MKKVILTFCVTIFFYLIISQVPTRGYNIVVYGIFLALMIYLLFLELKQMDKARKGMICRGFIVDVIKEDKTADSDYILNIKFFSPLDNKEYIIKVKSVYLPEGKFIDILFDEENPYKSVIYKKLSLYRLILFIVSILFFGYKLLINI